MEGPAERGGGSAAEGSAGPIAEIRAPGPRPLRLLEWKVSVGAAVQIGSVLALCAPLPPAPRPAAASQGSGAGPRPQRSSTERKLKAERPGVVRELCARPGQVIAPGGVLVRLEGCSHPVVMKGLCAECGQDLTQIRSKNGKQNVPLSTATVSMVHSVPELKVSSEQAEQLGREDQQRLHRNRKLVLMVDLDQTLIHTTEQHCQQMSNKGIFHFQLGRGEPMLHTRLRPHCKEFLEKIAKLYELHVFTFGSRLYAHTIAGFLDPEKKLFSHRILSRDECIDPFSKTGNLRDLFPCGDSMVCIIDDREDVWKFAPNLITVKKYVYFQGIGDINAPPGSREIQMKKKINHSAKAEAQDSAVTLAKDADEVKNATCIEEQNNGLKKATKDVCPANGNTSVSSETPACDLSSHGKVNTQDSLSDSTDDRTDSEVTNNLSSTKESQISSEQVDRTVLEKQQTQEKTSDLDFELSSDSESEGGLDTRKSSTSVSDSENEEKRSWKKSKQPLQDENPHQGSCTDVSEKKDGQVNHSEGTQSLPSENILDKTDTDAQEESEQESVCDLGNGCADKKEAETESQNSEQSGITMGESLDQSVEEEEEEDDTDDDDHLMHLEEILVRVHTDYYTKYDKYLKKEIEEIPDIRKIVPELKSKVLADVTIIFSGLYPTNFPIEKTREHYHATALGAKIVKNLVLSADDPDKATHLIAARTGTEKVRQAQDCKDLHVVNPDWLWSCLERWDKVEEQLFPLKDDYIKTHRENSPATFPDTHSTFQTALFHPTPIHPKSQPGPEVRLYDPNTGKLIRKGGSQTSGQSMYIQSPAPPITLPVHGEHSSFRVVQPHQQQIFEEDLPVTENEEQPGPSKRKRQPSMSETMPLYTLCKEDLESMDKEVDDILGEGSDESDSEKKKPEEKGEKPQISATEATGVKTDPRPRSSSSSLSSSSSEKSLTGSVPRGMGEMKLTALCTHSWNETTTVNNGGGSILST
ncbi:RNA polymerase II subunit A C-terminal domain phosphatase isoform X2 [Tympanuchus pallidicinctus]|uniref:RNA polymerase II subunit A C-terminal domain phosphatase isoform X2 n=1 Tax=Tympanuchus pallidicinctus TaxID=109042 RepID=UPI002287083E|nr:RNA polymerase II subunit A C-terminal domain phosphatase isoform X2 [Tympanuchus pallidicinctus]